jgi:Carboxypeptidase regulatory-like domain
MKPTLVRVRCVACLSLILPMVAQSPNAAVEDAYENHNQIDYGPLKLRAVLGIATDPAGIPTPSALVLLFSEPDHHLLSKTTTNADGRFSLGKVKHGLYRLVVKEYGFCSANVPIVVKAGADGKQLAVHMKVGGVDTCSYGDLK